MNEEELRAHITSLMEKNKSEMGKVEELMANRSAESDSQNREEISKTDGEIDGLLSSIENRNKEIERNDKLLSLRTNSSMTKRNDFKNLDNSESRANNESEMREVVNRWFKTGDDKEYREKNALQQGIATAGGNTVAPEYLVDGILKNADDEVLVRRYAKKLPAVVGYDSIGIVTFENDLDDSQWTPEIAEVPEDKSMTFGKRSMKPNQLTKLVLISKQLIRNSNIDIQAFVEERIAYKLAVPLEKNYLYGNGDKKPLGMFAQKTDNSAAISDSRDIAIGTSKEALCYDGFVDALSGLKNKYQKRAIFMLNKSAITALRKLKDNNDRTLWQESITTGAPSVLLGVPVIQNDFIVDTLTKGQYAGLLCDMSYYWILDSFGMELQVLYELYSRTNQVGFQSGYWGDGQPVLEEAFVRLLAFDGKAASSGNTVS